VSPSTPATNSRRVALVTGGAIRVGRAIALELARTGHDVAFTYRSSTGPAEVTLADIEALGVRGLAVKADLASARAPARVVEQVLDGMGRLDVLVNSAASFEVAALAETRVADFDAQVALNVRAPLLLAQAAAAVLAATGRGRVINIVDASAYRPFAGQLVHSLTKAALLNLTRGLARELGPDVQCHAVVPGAVAPPEDWDESETAQRVGPLPVPRAGSADDVAQAVSYLATCSPFATGSVLHVDGGDSCVGYAG